MNLKTIYTQDPSQIRNQVFAYMLETRGGNIVPSYATYAYLNMWPLHPTGVNFWSRTTY